MSKMKTNLSLFSYSGTARNFHHYIYILNLDSELTIEEFQDALADGGDVTTYSNLNCMLFHWVGRDTFIKHDYGGESHSFGSFPSHVGRFCGGLMLRRVDVVGFEGKVWKTHKIRIALLIEGQPIIPFFDLSEQSEKVTKNLSVQSENLTRSRPWSRQVR
jgi:hypothetical protein